MFSARQRIRRWKSFSGLFHLATVSGLAFSLLWVLPQLGNKSPLQLSQDLQQQQERRQLLLEALDKMARYQKYYGEIHGRFTRDLSRLSVPARFTSGKQEELIRAYEISVLEVRPSRFLLLATGVGSSDRVTIDESFRINANFVLPAPTRAYLMEEADRLLRLKAHGGNGDGLFSKYWTINREDAQNWVAVGVRNPVIGERREVTVSLFSSVRDLVNTHLAPAEREKGEGRATASVDSKSPYKELLATKDVTEWLEKAHLAQHVHWREKGRYARRWDELDTVSDYRFSERMKYVKNVRVHPVEVTSDEGAFQMTIEGTNGDLMGEQFVVDKSGSVRQVRYTETLIEQLQQTTNLLENFQINPIVDEPKNTSLDSPKTRPIR